MCVALKSETKCDIKYHTLHDFGTSIPFTETPSDHFKDLYKLKLLTNSGVNLISYLRGVMDNVLHIKFVTLLGMTSDWHQKGMAT